MKLEKMISSLNKYCHYSLSIANFNGEWELHSYDDNTLFKNVIIKNYSFKRLILVAYRDMLLDMIEKNKEKINRITNILGGVK